MLLSRTLAKRRIAAGARPTRVGAWLPVGFDALCLLAVFALMLGPFQTMTETFNFPLWATIAALLALVFIPIQAVLIFSSLWATKSRWIDTETDA